MVVAMGGWVAWLLAWLLALLGWLRRRCRSSATHYCKYFRTSFGEGSVKRCVRT